MQKNENERMREDEKTPEGLARANSYGNRSITYSTQKYAQLSP